MSNILSFIFSEENKAKTSHRRNITFEVEKERQKNKRKKCV